MSRFLLIFCLIFLHKVSSAQEYIYVVYEGGKKIENNHLDKYRYILLDTGGKTYFFNLRSEVYNPAELLADFDWRRLQYKPMMIDNETGKLYENIVIKNDRVTAYEDIPEINWKIESDTKLIDGMKAQKATADFRGREWTVWFTTEIPISEGPWKLRGLPGLILEADNPEYSFKAVFINLRESLYPEDLKIFFENKVPKAIPIKEAIVGENEFLEDNMSKLMTELPDVNWIPKDNIRDDQLEVIFEWEE